MTCSEMFCLRLVDSLSLMNRYVYSHRFYKIILLNYVNLFIIIIINIIIIIVVVVVVVVNLTQASLKKKV